MKKVVSAAVSILVAASLCLCFVFSAAAATESSSEQFTVVNGVLKGYTGQAQKIIVPGGVTEINQSLFINDVSAQAVVLPAGIKKIGNKAFENCKNLKEINLPAGLTAIGENCFKNCSSLKSIKIPGTVKSISANAFAGCTSLQKVEICSGVQTVQSGAFTGDYNLTELVFPKSVKKIAGQIMDFPLEFWQNHTSAGVELTVCNPDCILGDTVIDKKACVVLPVRGCSIAPEEHSVNVTVKSLSGSKVEDFFANYFSANYADSNANQPSPNPYSCVKTTFAALTAEQIDEIDKALTDTSVPETPSEESKQEESKPQESSTPSASSSEQPAESQNSDVSDSGEENSEQSGKRAVKIAIGIGIVVIAAILVILLILLKKGGVGKKQTRATVEDIFSEEESISLEEAARREGEIEE